MNFVIQDMAEMILVGLLGFFIEVIFHMAPGWSLSLSKFVGLKLKCRLYGSLDT